MLFAILWLAVSSCGKDNTITHPPLDPSLDTHITGYVRNADGSPIANNQIKVYRYTPVPPIFSTSVTQTTSDANGYYQVAFDTDTASNITYGIYCDINLRQDRMLGETRVFKDSTYQNDFWMCPASTFRIEFQDDPNIVCDTYRYIVQLPSGCFEHLIGRRFASTAGYEERPSNRPQPFVAYTNSGGYAKFTALHFLNGQLVSTRVDSAYMTPNGTATVYLPY